MLFNSYIFIFGFLPCALVGYHVSNTLDRSLAIGWLIACSLLFYGYWNPLFLLLLLGSIAFNYTLTHLVDWADRFGPRLKTTMLVLGIGGDLLLLFYYKYLASVLIFFGMAATLPSGWADHIILPLGISFFTFTQIGYVLDCADGSVEHRNLFDYILFVTFFPHLIAGPILHSRDILPQFIDRAHRFRLSDLTVGMTIFVIGLFKKVVIADPFGQLADPGFAASTHISLFTAWLTVLSYALQLYFDFSGYSDMAIGIARSFGIRFPLNFNSPYKSQSIIEFWQRWHMTLTRYLTEFLYNPVALTLTRRYMKRGSGLSRKSTRSAGAFANMVLLPIFFTMTLAGVWHGAGLQFLVFGLLHAVYLSINHAWRTYGPRSRRSPELFGRSVRIASNVLLTFLAVIVAQVFFRATSVPSALSMLGDMMGLRSTVGVLVVPVWLINASRGLLAPVINSGLLVSSQDAADLKNWLYIVSGLLIVWGFPNTQQVMVNFEPSLNSVRPFPLQSMQWLPNAWWGLLVGAMIIVSLCNLNNVTRFLYFQF